jgi:uncharacterized paraquat-inducible protein A
MKKALLIVAFIFSGMLLGTSCKTEAKKEDQKEHVVSHKDVYQCPMKCEKEKTYDKEGKCPVCEMKLRKKVDEKPDEKHH